MKYQQIKSKIYKKMRKMYEQKSDKKSNWSKCLHIKVYKKQSVNIS